MLSKNIHRSIYLKSALMNNSIFPLKACVIPPLVLSFSTLSAFNLNINSSLNYKKPCRTLYRNPYRDDLYSSYLYRTSSYRNIHTSTQFNLNNKSENTGATNSGKSGNDSTKDNKDKRVTVYRNFDEVPNKNKNSYLDMVYIFNERDVHRRGHVEFIYSALKHMKEYGVHKDLEVYKSLVEVFPKGKFIPQNIFQAEFMHYPKQQQCAIDLLEQMEDNGVMPDPEMETMLLNVFGRRGHPLRKYWRMMYWMPKFRNLSPWPVPNPPPNEIFELAKMAISRICSVDVQSEISVYASADLEDSIEDTWIVSGQSPAQRKLLNEHNLKEPIYVEGPFMIWLRDKSVSYFTLRAAPKPLPEFEEPDTDDVSKLEIPTLLGFGAPPKNKIIKLPTVHEQEDGVIFGICATGTSSKDSLLSWIRLLEKDNNPNLGQASIVFTLRSAEKGVAVIEENNSTENKQVDTTS